MEKKEVILFLASEQQATNELLETMLENIGISDDSEFRDEVIFYGWYKLLENNRRSMTQKKWLFDTALREKLLFKGIKQGKTDDSFTRGFTSLLFRALLKDHNKNPWLEKEKIILLANDVETYLQLEKDTRGLVENKGWCHCFAHIADLMAELVRTDFPKNELNEVYLQGIKRANIFLDEFIFGEEMRLNKVIIALISENLLSEDELVFWLEEIQQGLLTENVFNLTHVHCVESLFFQLKGEKILFEKVFIAIEKYLEAFYQLFQIV